MRYEKPFLTYEAQAQRLLERGMQADPEQLVQTLQQVNYYRLSAYWYSFREADPDDPTGKIRLNRFREGTRFQDVWSRYTFDRQLRVLVMDAIERAEIAIRTRAVHLFCEAHGPFGYLDLSNFHRQWKTSDHTSWLLGMQKRVEHAREEFVRHYRTRYTEERHLPFWMLSSLMTFGDLFTFCRNLQKPMLRKLAEEFGLVDDILKSWLQVLNFVRNVCAHHGRLWNREMPIKPKIPRGRKHPEWHNPVKVPDNRIFGVLTVLRYLMNQVAPQSRWSCRLVRLLKNYPELSREAMGFPENWAQCPIWHNCRATHLLREVNLTN
ncbi:Abi family protein [Deferrisoma camini]|uniref:Abi family protein n=1 Tax=Deferrisoma camini TaxID=1035120 RepID=UPI00146DBB9A|nr:Abi family protein [Deferrisoma camini]